MFLTIPLVTVVPLRGMILNHLDPDRHDTEMETMDSFNGYNVTIDYETEKNF